MKYQWIAVALLGFAVSSQAERDADDHDPSLKAAETQVFNQGNKEQSQQMQAMHNVGQAASQVANAAGQVQNQANQTQSQQQQAASQVEGATTQAMQQGVSQTQQVANQLRQNQTTVAQDIQSTVSTTKGA